MPNLAIPDKDSSCPLGSSPQLLFDKCWFCACSKCALDILFLIDQSHNAEPLCFNPLVELQSSIEGLGDDLLVETLVNQNLVYEGARAQIDFAVDAIDMIPQELLDSGAVRIAAGFFSIQLPLHASQVVMSTYISC